MGRRDLGIGVLGLILAGCATSADPAPAGSGGSAGAELGGQGGTGGSEQGGAAQGGAGAQGGSAGEGGAGAQAGSVGQGGAAQGGAAQGGAAQGGSDAGGSGGSVSSSGSAGQMGTCPSSPSAGAETVLDDVEDGDDAILSADGRIGYWFSYKDDADSGSTVSSPTATAPGANSTTHAIQVTGKSSSVAEYGPGFGFPLLSVDVQGNSGASLSCPYDVSEYSGISLWLKASGATSVEVSVPTEATTPTNEGGSCATNCNDHFAKSVAVSSSWTKVDVPFSGLTQGGWGAPATFDAKGVTGIGFGVPPGVTFEVSVDELRLVP